MLMLDGMLAMASLCLFLAACLLFAGSKLTRWYADLGPSAKVPDFSFQVLALLLGAVAVGLMPTPDLGFSESLDLEHLPPTAAGAAPSSTQRIAQWASTPESAALALPPPSAHYELMLVAGNEQVIELAGSLDILAETLNRYYVVVEMQAYTPNGPNNAVQLSTGTLERTQGRWYIKLDAGQAPASFPVAETPVELQVDGDRLILAYEQGGTRFQQIWQQFPDS